MGKWFPDTGQLTSHTKITYGAYQKYRPKVLQPELVEKNFQKRGPGISYAFFQKLFSWFWFTSRFGRHCGDSQRHLFIIETERKKRLNSVLIQVLLVTKFVTLDQTLRIPLSSPSFLYVFQLLFIPRFLSFPSPLQCKSPQGLSYQPIFVYLSVSVATNNFLALSFCFLLQVPEGD